MARDPVARGGLRASSATADQPKKKSMKKARPIGLPARWQRKSQRHLP